MRARDPRPARRGGTAVFGRAGHWCSLGGLAAVKRRRSSKSMTLVDEHSGQFPCEVSAGSLTMPHNPYLEKTRMAADNGRRPASKALRFTRVKLGNWRNFVDVDVPLQRRAFLVGPNASGKSNLLDALRFLREIVIVGGGFQKAVETRGGVCKLRCLAARRCGFHATWTAIPVQADH